MPHYCSGRQIKHDLFLQQLPWSEHSITKCHTACLYIGVPLATLGNTNSTAHLQWRKNGSGAWTFKFACSLCWMTFSLQPQTTRKRGELLLIFPCTPIRMLLRSNRGLVSVCEHKTVPTQQYVWSAPCFWVTWHSYYYYVSVPSGSPTTTPGKKLCANLTWNCEYATVKKILRLGTLCAVFMFTLCLTFLWPPIYVLLLTYLCHRAYCLFACQLTSCSRVLCSHVLFF